MLRTRLLQHRIDLVAPTVYENGKWSRWSVIALCGIHHRQPAVPGELFNSRLIHATSSISNANPGTLQIRSCEESDSHVLKVAGLQPDCFYCAVSPVTSLGSFLSARWMVGWLLHWPRTHRSSYNNRPSFSGMFCILSRFKVHLLPASYLGNCQTYVPHVGQITSWHSTHRSGSTTQHLRRWKNHYFIVFKYPDYSVRLLFTWVLSLQLSAQYNISDWKRQENWTPMIGCRPYNRRNDV